MRSLTFILSFVLVTSLALIDTQTAEAQTSYKFDHDQSSLHMYGTSNVRDWDAKIVIENESITIGDDNPGENWVESLSFEMPVTKVDSDSRRLNNNIHEYLGEDDYPTMTFDLVEIIEVSESGDGYELTANGNLMINGVERSVDLTTQVEVDDNGAIRIQGDYETAMTNFDIDPPTAMMGSIRAEDDVQIEFDVTLVES